MADSPQEGSASSSATVGATSGGVTGELLSPGASSSSSSATPSKATPESGGSVKVFAPASSDGPSPAMPDDSFFEYSLADVQSYHASVLAKSKRLNEAPLLTSKHRDADREAKEKKKADKWPTTSIRIKFSDGTQIQNTFPSTSRIQPVYTFVRQSLAPSAANHNFTLYQPPRTFFPENPVEGAAKKANAGAAHRTHIVPPANYGHVKGSIARGLQGGSGGAETLNELGLVPQSVMLVKWDDADMNASNYPAPITEELRAKVAPLPPPVQHAAGTSPAPEKTVLGTVGDVKVPKWLQKTGLMKNRK